MIKSYLYYGFMYLAITLCINLFYLNIARAEDEVDRLMSNCANGDSAACDEIESFIKEHEKHLDNIIAHAESFQSESADLEIENNKLPNIIKSYPIILERYINSEIADPNHKILGLNSVLVKKCSQHLNDLFYVHNKEIPSLDSGHPDWAIIYMMTIDHYFRYCLKSLNSN